MDSDLKGRLSQILDLQVESLADLKDGVLLAKLVTRQLSNPPSDLETRIKTSNLQHIANRIINMNVILKAVRESERCPEEVRKLTAFNLLENQESLLLLLRWLVELESQSDKDVHPIDQEREGNALDNLYFVSAIKPSHHYDGGSPDKPMNDQHPHEFVQDVAQLPVRASSSAKILKPKTKSSFSDETQNRQQPSNFDDASPVNQFPTRSTERPPIPRFFDPNKHKSLRDADNMPVRHASLKEQLDESQKFSYSPLPEPQSGRIRPVAQTSEKRVPVEELHQQYLFETSSKHSSKRSNGKLEKLEQEVNSIELRLKKQRKELDHAKRQPFPSYLRPKEKPLEFMQVNLEQRKKLVEWLISINLLKEVALRNYDNLHLICRNGVIFPEVVNYKKGREQKLKYEDKNPNATEIRSNYKRLFEYLKEFPQFPRELLFRYEYFVPDVNEAAFWQLLNQLHMFYVNRSKLVGRQDLTIAATSPKKLKSTASLKHPEASFPSTDRQQGYNEIRFASEERKSHSRLSQRQNTRSSVHSQDSSEPKVREPVQRFKQPSEQASDRRVTEPPTNEKFEGDQPNNVNTSLMGTSTSYLQLRAKKELMVTPNRPQKSRNSHNTSMSRSRVSARNTPKQHSQRPEPPQVTLDMQIACLNYLKECNYPLVRVYKELFEDPIRNGTLLVLVVCRRFGCRAQFQPKPKNIEDCRDNYRTATKIIREHIPNFPKGYSECTEEIIKGEKNLFYGMVYTILQLSAGQNQAVGSNRKQLLKTDFDRSCSFDECPSLQASIVQWLGEKFPKLKNYYQVESAVKTGLLIVEILGKVTGKELKAIHEQPQYQFQCQANLVKAMQYLNEYTGQTSKYTWKINKLVAGEETTVLGLLEEIRKLETPRPHEQSIPTRPQSISFNQLLRSQQINQNYNTLNLNNTFENAPMQNSVSKPLETTMAGHQYSSNPAASTQKEEPEVEIDWMRRLGFTCSLAVNSGVILCRLVEKLTMRTIEGVNYSPHTRGEMLGNVRRVLKQLKKSVNGKMFEALDEQDILNAGADRTREIYQLVKQAYKHSYLFKPQQPRRTHVNNLHML